MPRSRRTCHAVPGSSERFIAKAVGLEADEIFLDLEDAVAPSEKDSARARVIEALNSLEFGSKTVAVRVNGTDTPHYYRDLIAVVEGAGARLDAIMLPKVRTPGDVEMTDKLLTQIELAHGPSGRPDRHRGADRGRDRADRVRGDRGRLTAHGDADLRSRRLQRGGRDPDHDDRRGAGRVSRRPSQLRLHAAGRRRPRGRHPGHRRAVRQHQGRRRAARAVACWRARWGSTASGRSTPARSRSSTRSSAPRPSSGSARRACSPPTSRRTRDGAGAAIFEGEMIDEANRKMAERIAFAGRAAGYER